ncbi:MAG: tetratricopeptide repeat protein [Flavobacteriales bacterium]
MKKRLIILLGIFLTTLLQGQQIKELLDQGKIDEALDLISQNENLSAEDYYYTSIFYHQKGYSQEAIKYIGLAIEKEKTAEYYQFLAFLQNKNGDCQNALKSLDEAYKLEPSTQAQLMKAKVYHYCFKEPNYDKAISIYQEILKMEPNMEAVQSLSLLYTNQNRYKQAHDFLENLLKERRFSEHKDYIQFINATLYFEEKNLEKAEEQLNALLTRDPKDYISLAKLIQVRYAQNRSYDTETLRKRLYKGYETKQLPEFIKDRFQFDQFSVGKNTVKAFETFSNEKDDEEGTQVLHKHIFEVYNTDQFLYTIQTEYNAAIPMYKQHNLDYNYYIGKTVYGEKYEHFNYGPHHVDVVLQYPKIKQLVTGIVENKLQPQKNSKTTIEKF